MLRFVKRFTPTFRSLLKTGSRGDQELNFQVGKDILRGIDTKATSSLLIESNRGRDAFYATGILFTE